MMKLLHRLLIYSCVVGLLAMVFTSPVTASSYKKIKAQLEKNYGVKIRFTKIKFPKHSRENYTVTYKPVPWKARKKVLLNLKKDLKKYRRSTVRHFVRTVYIFRSLKFDEVFAAGTYEIHKDRRASLYVKAAQLGNKHGVFHHEFSSLILTRYPSNLRELWEAHNTEDFEYTMEGIDGPEVVRNGNADLKGSPKFWQQGFVVGYGTMDFENDFNTFFEAYMAKREKLNRIAAQYPRIRKKMELLAEYFQTAEDHIARKEQVKSTEFASLTFSKLTHDVRKKFGIGPNAEGVAITKVIPQSSAAKNGLLAGFLILEVMHHKVFTPKDVFKQLERVKKSSRANAILLVLRPDGERVFVSLPLKP